MDKRSHVNFKFMEIHPSQCKTRRQLATDPEMYGLSCSDHQTKVYRLRKALYGLKQAPRAWYDELSNFLASKGFTKADMFTKALQERFQYLSDELRTSLSSQAVNKSPTHYPCDSARTFRVILFSIHNDEWKSFQCHHQTALRRPYALSWKPCQGDSLNLPDHRIHKDGDGDASFQLKSDSLPHAHAQTTKTFYKHQDSRIMKAQELKTKTSAQTLIYKIFLQRYQVYQGRLLASFQDDAKYEHVGQDTRSQGGKDDQDGRIKI
ncbi:ribonuclease H [Tanacetum coccineum]